VNLLLKKLPIGIGAAPFEFAFFSAYGIATGKYLIDRISYSSDPDVSQLAALPLQGANLWIWISLLFVGCVTTCIGLLVNGYRPAFGLRVERAGLSMAGAMLVYYLVELINLVGFTFSLGLLALLLEMGAVWYRIAIVGRALDALEGAGDSK
jgi:hypothetical protein